MTGKKEKSQRQQKESSQLIEDIFAAVKKTKEEKPVESVNPLPKKKTKKTPKLSALPSSKKRSAPHSSSTGEDHQDLDDLFKDVREKRTTEDGLRIIDAADLNIGKGGATPGCPFDCWCCY